MCHHLPKPNRGAVYRCPCHSICEEGAILEDTDIGARAHHGQLPPHVSHKYIADFPPEVQQKLQKVRQTIKAAAPGAEEAISYRIPTFKLNGNLVHFAAFKHHIGFYPTASGIAKFKEKLSAHKGAKGSVQFPLTSPIPYSLITKIVKFRVKESLAEAKARKH